MNIASAKIIWDNVLGSPEAEVICTEELPEKGAKKSRKINMHIATAAAAKICLLFVPVVDAMTPTQTAKAIIACSVPRSNIMAKRIIIASPNT